MNYNRRLDGWTDELVQIDPNGTQHDTTLMMKLVACLRKHRISYYDYDIGDGVTDAISNAVAHSENGVYEKEYLEHVNTAYAKWNVFVAPVTVENNVHNLLVADWRAYLRSL